MTSVVVGMTADSEQILEAEMKVDLVPERLARARGVDTIDLTEHAVIDAVGTEAHGSPIGRLAQQAAGLLPEAIAGKLLERGGLDRLNALYLAIDMVRRGRGPVPP
jgi:hypothetical protein